MKNLFVILIGITALFACVYIIFFYSAEEMNSTTENLTVSDIEIEESETNVNQQSEDKSIAQPQDIKLNDISFTVPGNWQRVDDSEFYTLPATENVTFRSENYTERTVPEGMHNETNIATGARIGIGIESANVAENIATSEEYANFQNKLNENCNNCDEARIVMVDGLPAAFFVSSATGGGGSAQVKLYRNGNIISIGLKFGSEEVYSNYQEIFLQIIDSVKFE